MTDNANATNSQERNESSSKEVNELKSIFTSLITTRRFETNDFLYKTDEEAIMDLAAAETLFR